MNIVTGATGFLGAHVVCQLLKAGKSVRAFKRHTSDLKEFNTIYNWYFKTDSDKLKAKELLFWFIVDVLDVDTLQEGMKEAEVVYHCAAMVSFFSKDRDTMMKINVEGTANVVNLSLQNGIKQFCFVSSIASLGRKKNGAYIDETNHWEESNLNSNYAISKYKAELEVWRGAEEGLNVVIVNPGIIIGVGAFDKGSNHLFHSVFKKIPFYSMGVKGFVDANDVARAMLILVERKISHHRYVLVSENCTFKDLFFAIADGFKIKRPFIEVKPWMAGLSWRIAGIIRLFSKKGIGITKETASAAVHESLYSSQKIKKELSFEFSPIGKTIQDCCISYLEQHKNK